MGKWTQFDMEVIKVLRREGIFEDGNTQKLESPDGEIVVTCADGDQMPDMFSHQCELADKGGWPVRPHVLSLHGGAMLMAEDCPLYQEFRVDELLLQHIREAEGKDLKGIGTVFLYIHVPCGAAGLAKLNLVNQIVFLMRAKERVKEIDSTNKVLCFVHVDYGTGRRRTYFISYTKWMEFWKEKASRLGWR
ncbi:MAG: hypothetical protein UT30_C0005G0024 [Candidatus Uhrbacteria bacterium GW2011_GWF2_39_13]|uniref:Uncharacterized protein n=1 Tax=Candidatus Uhrbacteria bacterium GW2011_GWF2_39_13 TaxID=1618995 RepID=A0A0G0MW35_9BACT|nr:MAG: hypothetical protein UT30_C0005G0024 [Candidatus Uhrbacteria bacterium GW2011_GWF2_39_13]